jgi:hypothetical protein
MIVRLIGRHPDGRVVEMDVPESRMEEHRDNLIELGFDVEAFTPSGNGSKTPKEVNDLTPREREDLERMYRFLRRDQVVTGLAAAAVWAVILICLLLWVANGFK